jgi:hypothetical protein
VIRVKFDPLFLDCKLGPYTIKFDLSDPDGCFTTYTYTLTGKNTKPMFDPSPPVISDLSLAINQLFTIDIKEVKDNENSTLTLTCLRMLGGADNTTTGLITNEWKVDADTKK